MNPRNLIFLYILFLLHSCSYQHLINDPEKRDEISKRLSVRKTTFGSNQYRIISSLDNISDIKVREGVKFLYAYSPLTDLTIDRDILIRHVETTIKATEDMPWGKEIPEDIFLHFVLPIRVNNENVDSARVVFYEELKDRVKGLSMYDAALEVNHWCHEKVIYTPSDSRTSSPLATVRTAYGRCGEESVFTVAALRSVGIPARQVYTPRWAHSDDNHAWVELWIDGKWYYLGACEPEPKLNIGWFSSTATRGMLMHTKVFGDYKTQEEIMSKTDTHTEINVTENYAPVKKIVVNAVNEKGDTVTNADIDFMVFNYAEFFPVAKKKSDENGECSITLGLGDVLVWARKNGKFGYAKLSVANQDSVVVKLDNNYDSLIDVVFDIVPPMESKSGITVTKEERDLNNQRLQLEDSLRNAYVDGFMTRDMAIIMAKNLGVNSDLFAKYIKSSRGNYREICNFMMEAKDHNMAMDLLSVISEKDLRDAEANVLLSHLNNISRYKTDISDPDIFKEYILCPRIANEKLTKYAEFFRLDISESLTIDEIIDITKRISLYPNSNVAVAPVAPVDVWKITGADSKSLDIFFVALSRSCGIPARLNPVDSRVQYMNGAGEWIDVSFDKNNAANDIQPKGTLTISYSPTKSVPEPKYEKHFTIARLNSDYSLKKIDLNDNIIHDMGASEDSQHLFEKPIELEAGKYILTSGNRLANGAVMSSMKSFVIEQGKNCVVDLVIRENSEDLFVIGSINPEARITTPDAKDKSLLDVTGRGYYVVALVQPDKEPTNHAVRNLATMSAKFKEWGRPLVIAFKDNREYGRFKITEPANMPVASYVIDSNNMVSDMFMEAGLDTSTLPIVVVADSFGRVVYTSVGYNINLGDQLSKVIDALK